MPRQGCFQHPSLTNKELSYVIFKFSFWQTHSLSLTFYTAFKDVWLKTFSSSSESVLSLGFCQVTPEGLHVHHDSQSWEAESQEFYNDKAYHWKVIYYFVLCLEGKFVETVATDLWFLSVCHCVWHTVKRIIAISVFKLKLATVWQTKQLVRYSFKH